MMHVDSTLSSSTRDTLAKWMPLVLAIGLVWLLARGLRQLFWTGFGLFWAFWWVGAWWLR